MTTADALDRWLRPEAPRERLAVARVLIGSFALGYLLVRLRYFADLSRLDASELVPVGVAALLTRPLSGFVTWTLALATAAAGAAFVGGARMRVSGPLFAVLFLWVTTYRSSWGKILHSENLVALHLVVLAFGCAASDAPKQRGWTLRAMAIVTALTYFVAGVTKLRVGGLGWLRGRALGDWLAYDALRKIELGSLHSPVAAWMVSRPALLFGLAVFTLVVELSAPIALVSLRSARVWAALAWGFHVGVLATMAIGFFYPLSGIAFAPLFPLERLAPWPKRLLDAVRRSISGRGARRGRARSVRARGPCSRARCRPTRPR